jgi:hypothetical protein
VKIIVKFDTKHYKKLFKNVGGKLIYIKKCMIKKFTDFFKRNKNHEDLTNKNIVKVDNNYIDRNSVAVENYEGVLQFICDDVKKSIKLTTYLKEELTQIFGKHFLRKI